ncbi:hypothetical protein Q7P35_005755 [Cladosporium inversicolor]
MAAPHEEVPQSKGRISPSSARAFAAAVLTGNGLSTEDATTVADCLVAADLRGVDTHGINRLPSYMTRAREGITNPKAQPEVTELTPVVAQVDGKNAFGAIPSKLGMAKAIEMASKFGIGMVSIKHSNHFGMAAWLCQQAIDANMLSLVFTNSSPAMPAWGGRSKLLGREARFTKRSEGEKKIPTDWALDGEGRFTDDPAAALEGVMLPMGGPKGSALAVMMDVFSGVLSGSAFAGHVTGPYDFSKPADVGHFLIAIKPDLFVSAAEFRERLEYLYQRVTGSEKMEGVDRIYFPGEIEQLNQADREANGIPFVQAEIDALNDEARAVGAPTLWVDRWEE